VAATTSAAATTTNVSQPAEQKRWFGLDFFKFEIGVVFVDFRRTVQSAKDVHPLKNEAFLWI
jgi:hypothetical protein